MRDILQDIVNHTNKLGFLNIVKVTGDDQKTQVDSMADDRSVIMYAETKDPQPSMKGVFGMPQLEKLRYLVEGKEYQDGAKIEVVTANRNGEDLPVGLHFENKDGDFKNDYRFMTTEVINEKLKTVTFRGTNWAVTLEPTVAAIQRLKFQSQANSEEKMFSVKTEGTDLKFYFGDAASHAGNFVFQSGITGSLKREWEIGRAHV